MNALGACVTQWIIRFQSSSSIISVSLKYYNKSIYWVCCKKNQMWEAGSFKICKIPHQSILGKQFLILISNIISYFCIKG